MRISEKEQKQKLNIFFIVEFLACAVMVLCTTRQLGSIASAAFTGSFLLLVAWFAKMVLLDGKNHHLAITFMIVVLSTICVIVSAILNEEEMTMAYFTDHLVFLSTILYLFVIMNSEVDKKTFNGILIISVLIAWIYPIAYWFFPQESRTGLLELNFSNPNLTSIWLLQSALYAVVAVVILRSWFWRALALVSVPINIWLITLTESRNALLSLALFGVLCAWMTFKQSSRFAKAVVMGVNLLPIVFVPVYMTYVNLVIERGWFAFLMEEGKNLDSRVWIWNNRFEAIEGLWLIGNYAGVGANSHNSHMVLLSSYGVIGLVLGTYLLCAVCLELNEQSKSRKNLYSLAAFFGVLFMGIGEGALFSGGIGVFIPACGFLYLAKCDFGADTAQALPWQRKKQE